MLACTLFNEQNKGPSLLSIITWFILGKQNVQVKKVNLLNKLTNSTLPSNSWLKHQSRDYFPRHSGVQRRKIKKRTILDIKTHYKPTENFQYTHFNSCHPPGVKNGFIKGEAMRLLRTNSSKTTFEESLVEFKQHLRTRGYPKTVIERLTLPLAHRLQHKRKILKRGFCFLLLCTTQQWTTSNRHWWNNGV